MKTQNKKHYEIRYDIYGERIIAMYCNYCNYGIYRSEVKPTKTGHRWPRMSHSIKQHLRDVHKINLYKGHKKEDTYYISSAIYKEGGERIK